MKQSWQKKFAKELSLYFVIGFSASILDFGIFTLVTELTNFKHVVLANILGTVVGCSFSFALNMHYNFKTTNKIFARFLAQFCICSIGLAVSSLGISLLEGKMDISLLKLLMMSLVAIMQFFLSKFITFRN